MNPFLSKNFIIITLAFIICVILTIAFHFRGNAQGWTWQDNPQANAMEIADFDWLKSYPTETGMLIIAQSSRNTAYYSSYNLPYHDYNYQVLFADETGILYIDKGDNSFYNAACDKTECVLFFDDGRRVLNLSDYSITKMQPWQDKYGEQFSTLIMGKILHTQNDQTYLSVSNEAIFKTLDKGSTWQYLANVRDLVKSYYPEEIADNSNFSFATQNNELIIWYSYGNDMGSLEITLDTDKGKVVGHKWLPLRINEVEQSPNGNIYAIAQEPSRKLFSLLQFNDNGEFSVITENGYNHLHSLHVSNQTVLLNEDWRGQWGYLLMNVTDGNITHRAELSDFNRLFNNVDNTFIKLANSYSNDIEINNGGLVKYSVAR